jgi:hypothetical protein
LRNLRVADLLRERVRAVVYIDEEAEHLKSLADLQCIVFLYTGGQSVLIKILE